MFAIVEVAGQQFKIEKDQKIFVHRLAEKEGEQIILDRVLLFDEDGKTHVGMPAVKNMQVKATVISHLKGDKVKVFKKKRRKGYQVLNGHRQYLTELRIDTIEKRKAAVKTAQDKKKPPVTKTETKAKPRTASSTAKKPSAKTTKKETTEKKVIKPSATAKSSSGETSKKSTVTKATRTKSTTKKTPAKSTAKTEKASSATKSKTISTANKQNSTREKTTEKNK